MRKICLEYDFSAGILRSASDCGITDLGDAVIYSMDTLPLEADEIVALLRTHGESITTKLGGVYLFAVHDKKSGEVWAFHDALTSPFALYYFECGGKAFISTTLRFILPHLETREMSAFVGDFRKNGFIDRKETLVKNVCKLCPSHALKISGGKIKQVGCSYQTGALSQQEAAQQWYELLDKSVADSLCGNAPALALSSGYDSNYILSSVLRQSSCPVDAFSVGGVFGTNELAAVKENVAELKNVQLHEIIVDSTMLSCLRDIVLRLEGCCFERGIFLQYILAKTLAENGVKNFLCGECADQIFNKNFYEKPHLPDAPGKVAPKHFNLTSPYEMAAFVILKKSGILLNSFGIVGRYPFLEEAALSLASATKDLNGTSKAFHKQQCREVFSKTVCKNLRKIGGSTSYSALFKSEEEIKKFIEDTKKSPMYSVSAASKIKSRCINLAKKILRRSSSSLRSMNRESDLCGCMTTKYLEEFYDLFVSGKHDDDWTEE